MSKNVGPVLVSDQVGGENPIPPKFIAAMGRHQTTQARPNPDSPDALTTQIVESKVETNRTDERVRSTVSRNVTGPITLRSTNTNDQGQPVQVTEVFDATSTLSPSAPNAYTKTSLEDLGNGQSIKTAEVEGTYDNSVPPVFTPGVFAGELIEVEQQNPIPESMRNLFKQRTQRDDVAGTITAPTLSHGDVSRSEEQLTPYKKRVTATTIDLATVPQSQVDREVTEHGVAVVTRTLDVNSGTTTDEGFLVVESHREEVGQDLSLTTTKVLGANAYPIEYAGEIDPTYVVPVHISKQIIEKIASTVNPTFAVTAGEGIKTEYKELDKYRTIQIISKLKALPATKTWWDTAIYTFPDTLISAKQVASYLSSSGNGYDIAYEIKNGYSGPIKVFVTESFTYDPPADEPAPTLWFPREIRIVTEVSGIIIGAGTLRNIACTIPPTLHGDDTEYDPIDGVTWPATTPSALTNDSPFLKSQVVSRWDFGAYKLRTEIGYTVVE